MAETLRLCPAANILHRAKMQRFQEKPVILGFAPLPGRTGVNHHEHVFPVRLTHLGENRFKFSNQTETYESQQIR